MKNAPGGRFFCGCANQDHLATQVLDEDHLLVQAIAASCQIAAN